MKKIFLAAMIIFALAMPVFVSVRAQTACPPGKTGLNCATGILDKVAGTGTGLSSDLATTVATVIKAVLALVGTIFLVLTIYAGVLWMTAQGEETKIEKAKETIKASIIGLIVIMSAYAITAFVTSRLGGASGTSNSNPNQLGCCYAPDYSVCAPNNPQSNCGTNALWQAGSCPTGHPPECP